MFYVKDTQSHATLVAHEFRYSALVLHTTLTIVNYLHFLSPLTGTIRYAVTAKDQRSVTDGGARCSYNVIAFIFSLFLTAQTSKPAAYSYTIIL